MKPAAHKQSRDLRNRQSHEEGSGHLADEWRVMDDDMYYARRENKPTGENALHYDIVNAYQTKTPDVILTAGLGENQIIR